MNLGLVVPLADNWGMHDGGGWWMIVMMPVMLLFWVAVILGVVWLARGGFDGWRGERRETPTEILDRRFAEGAISVEDYHARRDAIGTGTRRGSVSSH